MKATSGIVALTTFIACAYLSAMFWMATPTTVGLLPFLASGLVFMAAATAVGWLGFVLIQPLFTDEKEEEAS